MADTIEYPRAKFRYKVSLGDVGVLTPMPCVPVTAAPWAPGNPTILIGGKPALDNTCKLLCCWGGVIQAVNPGQMNIMD